MYNSEYKKLDKNNRKLLFKNSSVQNFITAKNNIEAFYLRISLPENELIARKLKLSARNKTTNNLSIPLLLSFLFSIIFYDSLTNLIKELTSMFNNFTNQIEKIVQDALLKVSDSNLQNEINEYFNDFQHNFYPTVLFFLFLTFIFALVAVFLCIRVVYIFYRIILRHQTLDEYEISKIDYLLTEYEKNKDFSNTFLTFENDSYLLRYQLIYVEKKNESPV